MDEIKDILRAIRSGCNPITGEIFDTKILSEDPTISREILKLALQTQGNIRMKKLPSVNALGRDADAIFKELRAWRLDVAHIINLPAYYVFSDKDLWEIAKGDVVEIDDLLFIKGINHKKYELYAADIFEILKPYIEKPLSTSDSSSPAKCKSDIRVPEIDPDTIAGENGESYEDLKKFIEEARAAAESAEEDGDSPVKSCKNCMLYRSEDCIGKKEICEFYRHAPTISKDEMDNWPKEMQGPYSTPFRRDSRNKKGSWNEKKNQGRNWAVKNYNNTNNDENPVAKKEENTQKSETRVVKRPDCKKQE